MALFFPSDAWVKSWMEKINQDEHYARVAVKWEGDFYFIIEPVPHSSLHDPVTLYVDLWHGKCRDALAVSDPGKFNPAFMISAKVDQWKKVILGQMEPVQGMMTGALKLKGNLVTIMRSVNVATALVRTLSLVDTEFPL